jgi:hypothetical protein
MVWFFIRHVWLLSNASIPKSRMLVPCISIVSPSITVAMPEISLADMDELNKKNRL